MYNIKSVYSSGIYEDLMREFLNNNHNVYIATPVEKRFREDTNIVEENNCKILKIKTGNLQKTSFIKKGISTFRITSQFKFAIKKYFRNVKFDLIIYSTPPITLDKVVEYVKKRDNAKTFLLLKDIFPQNAVDLGILSKKGLKGIIYKYFRKKEKQLYSLSDKIGCMSQANVDYIVEHNSEVDKSKLTIVPNSIEPKNFFLPTNEKVVMRKKYDIPLDKVVFVYGGNLGKPQDVPFIIKCLKSQIKNEEVFFLIVGDGTEYHLLEEYFEKDKPKNVKVMKRLPKEDFDAMVASCDVGMIFLDHRFTIPNYPSRLLSYMQARIPVLACTDKNTDIGDDIENGGFGWKCESNDVNSFVKSVTVAIQTDKVDMGQRGRQILIERFNVNVGYKTIMSVVRE